MLGPIVVHLHHQAMASQNFASWSSALGPKIYSSLGITFQLKYSFLIQQYTLQDTTFIHYVQQKSRCQLCNFLVYGPFSSNKTIDYQKQT